MKITVFTPTYNRAYILNELYASLKHQSYKNFEWIIVDDGSTDNTKDLVESFIDEKQINIIYKKTQNGGKHRVINLGVQLATGQLFFIVDSDDRLPYDALENIVRIESTIDIDDKKYFAGVCGLKGYYSNNQMLGSTFKGDIIDATSLERQKYGIYGDKAEVFYTQVLKKYPFPEFEGENFITENVVWYKIAHDGYKLRFFNDVVYLCEYLEDGLSFNSRKKYAETPKGSALYISQNIDFGVLKGLEKWEKLFEYYLTFRNKIGFVEIAKNLRRNPVFFYFRIFGMRLFYKIYR